MSETTSIHRLLDEAFRGVEMTPEAQDFKEELRGNLVARVAELGTQGVDGGEAAHQAIAELGDVAELLDDGVAGGREEGFEAAQRRNRVRPKPAFVVRTVAWVLLMVFSVAVIVAASTGLLVLVPVTLIAPVCWFALALAWLVGDALSQETTTNHPMPLGRAAGYFYATFLATASVGVGVLIILGALPLWTVVFVALGVIGAIILFAYLAATQTNRRKAWARRAQAGMPSTRFEDEPETAARFGIYTVVIWTLTIAAMTALVVTVGWWWAALALVVGFAFWMLVLARMLFAPHPPR